MNPTNEEPGVYHVYLRRLWRSEYQGRRQWRASLESPHTVERQLFSNLEQFFAFLSEHWPATLRRLASEVMDILAPRKEELLKAYEPDRTYPNQGRGWEGLDYGER